MPSKQFTFKTTKSTSWLTELLDTLPKSGRSDFIREMIISGMEHNGYLTWDGRNPVISMEGMGYNTPHPPFYMKTSDTDNQGQSAISQTKPTPLEKSPIEVLRENRFLREGKEKIAPEKTTQNQIEKMQTVSTNVAPVWEEISPEEELEDFNTKLDSMFEDD